MDNLNLVSTFAEFKELKNIDKSTMIGVLEDVFRHLLIKTYETDENFDVIINPEKGDLEIWRNRTVVEVGMVENPNQQISLSDARKIDATYEVGEEVAERDQALELRSAGLYCHCARIWLPAFWISKKPVCSTNTPKKWVRSSPARCTKHGKRRFSCSTTRTTN